MILGINGIIAGRGISPLLLDTYGGAAAAYSLRKLRTAYTGDAITVRRSSDNTSQQIGFDANGNLDTASMLSFVGAGNGFVTTWFDQSGNNRNATQVTEANQPQIVSAGNLLTLNGKSRVNFQNKSLNFTGFGSSNFSIFTVLKRNTISNYGGYLQNVGSSFNGFKIVTYPFATTWFSTFLKYNGTVESLSNSRRNLNTSLSTQYIENWNFPNNTATLFENNISRTVSTDIGSGWGNNQTAAFGSLAYDGTVSGNFDIQEMVIYNTNQTANVSGINTNINTYYTIY